MSAAILPSGLAQLLLYLLISVNNSNICLLPALMRGAALRFWISRLWDLHLPRSAAALVPHDPTHFERVLRERVASPWHPPS